MMYINLLWTFIVFILNLNHTTGIIHMPGKIQEYCQFETFNPVCNDNEVVVIESAFYGRMKLGRCVSVDMGHIGCSSNALKEVDGMCSGLNKCEISVPSSNMPDPESCLRELSRYLEVSYRCQNEVISVGTAPIYIASITAQSTSCGLHGAPWILEAEPGQQISISLIDFSWANTTGEDNVNSNNNRRRRCVKNYGYILDMDSDDVINICGGGKRTQELYKSNGNTVQIVIEEALLSENRFILKYKAIGCPDIVKPQHSWIITNGDKVTIGCMYSAQNWTLKCINNMWIGLIPGTCPVPTTEMVITTPISTTAESYKDANWLPSVSNNHVLAFAMGCVTLIICCSVIVLGIYCSRRYELKIREYRNTMLPKNSTYGEMGTTVDRQTLVYRPINTNCSFPVSDGTSNSNRTIPFEIPTDSLPSNNANTSRQLSNIDSYTSSTNGTIHEFPDGIDRFGTGYNMSFGQESNKYYPLESSGETIPSGREQVYQSIHHIQQGDLLG